MQEIRTEHLTVGYDKTPLIGDVNLSVRPGEILTLIGRLFVGNLYQYAQSFHIKSGGLGRVDGDNSICSVL